MGSVETRKMGDEMPDVVPSLDLFPARFGRAKVNPDERETGSRGRARVVRRKYP
jgi:hypothetical protein